MFKCLQKYFKMGRMSYFSYFKGLYEPRQVAMSLGSTERIRDVSLLTHPELRKLTYYFLPK